MRLPILEVTKLLKTQQRPCQHGRLRADPDENCQKASRRIQASVRKRRSVRRHRFTVAERCEQPSRSDSDCQHSVHETFGLRPHSSSQALGDGYPHKAPQGLQ